MASLEMLARSTADAPLKGVSFFLRFNGILLPPQVLEGMTNAQGMPLLTDSDGRLVFSRLPQGRWELWPFASREDYLAVFSGSPPPAPVSVMLTPGHHTAKLVFRPKHE
ncbi:MAG TPA: hypothetical protein VNI78_01180 [Vicinamibacterales bacterium]|nr:hypothetical protein [Vicinamibacterales bacterium]